MRKLDKCFSFLTNSGAVETKSKQNISSPIAMDEKNNRENIYITDKIARQA